VASGQKKGTASIHVIFSCFMDLPSGCKSLQEDKTSVTERVHIRTLFFLPEALPFSNRSKGKATEYFPLHSLTYQAMI
jgi:hypothetical protein